MPDDVRDTIVALSSPPGPGLRAIVRLSGPEALTIVGQLFHCDQNIDETTRQIYSGAIALPGTVSPLPAEVYVWPLPKTYTGQLMVEIHTLSSPPLVDSLIAQCLAKGARAASPGEFTMRAFLAGKLDLTRAEAVHAVVSAGSRDELQHSLRQLAGGMSDPLKQLRADLLDLLADVEAAMDFADENIEFVGQTDLLMRITKGMGLVTTLGQQLNRRSLSERPFRVVLAGPPNAGKSSLFNALGRKLALVSDAPGTTRDYLVQRLEIDGVFIDLIDVAGSGLERTEVEGAAQQLGGEQKGDADLILLCQEAGKKAEKVLFANVVPIATKCDLAPAPPERLATSAKTGMGIDGLKSLLAQRAREHARPALAPSLARCRNHIENCLEHLRRAHHIVLEEEMPEILALELRGALDQLGEMVGAVYTDDLLDRIFSRFCVGK